MQDTDAIDRTILSILSREARIPMKSLAGRIGLSAAPPPSVSTGWKRPGSFAVTGPISASWTRARYMPSCF